MSPISRRVAAVATTIALTVGSLVLGAAPANAATGQISVYAKGCPATVQYYNGSIIGYVTTGQTKTFTANTGTVYVVEHNGAYPAPMRQVTVVSGRTTGVTACR